MLGVKVKNIPGPDTFCFTFGQEHRHPESGELMRGYWVEVTAPDSNTAREWMFENYGPKWSMMYTKGKFDSRWYAGGCYEEINLTEEGDGND